MDQVSQNSWAPSVNGLSIPEIMLQDDSKVQCPIIPGKNLILYDFLQFISFILTFVGNKIK